MVAIGICGVVYWTSMKTTDARFFLEIDAQSKIFHLSASVFEGGGQFPKLAAKSFFAANPSCSLHLVESGDEIILRKATPFARGPQHAFRQELYQFLQKARRCRKLLRRIAYLEYLRDVQAMLDS